MKIPLASHPQFFISFTSILVAIFTFAKSTAYANVQDTPGESTTDAINIHATYSGNPRSEVTVSWRTLKPIEHPKVRFAPQAEKMSEREGLSVSSANGYNHHVKLDGLIPGTEYRYHVLGSNGAWSPECRFRTTPADDAPVSFAVVGDVQGKDQPSGVWQKAGAFLAARNDLTFVVLMGDLVDFGGDQQHWDAFFSSVGEETGRSLFHTLAVMPIPGNHDYYARRDDGKRNDKGIHLFLDQFRLPPNGKFSEWNGRFYSVDVGSAKLVMLDTEGAVETRNRMQADQTEWLGELDFKSKTWNLAFLHRPVYPFLRHTPSAEARTVWRPHFFDRYFRVVFNGHNHAHAVSAKLRAGILEGMSGGRGFAGSWKADLERQAARGVTPMLLLEEGDDVDYAGYKSSGRAVYTIPQGSFDTTPIRMSRAIAPINTANHNELWLGFMYSKKSGFYAANQGGFRLSATNAPSRHVQVDTTRTEEVGGSAGRFRISIGDAEAVSQKLIAPEGRENTPTAPFFVLAKFVFQDGKTCGYLKQYSSPEKLPVVAPTDWDARIEIPGRLEAVFDTLTLLGESPQRGSLLDELRIGDNVASVVPPQTSENKIVIPWVEERFDELSNIAPDDGVIYYDAGGINHSGPPADFWYIRHRQEAGMKLVCIVEAAPEHLKVQTVFFDDFGDKKAGDVLHEFTLPPERPR